MNKRNTQNEGTKFSEFMQQSTNVKITQLKANLSSVKKWIRTISKVKEDIIEII